MLKDRFGGDDHFTGTRPSADQLQIKPRRSFQKEATSYMRQSIEEKVAETLEGQEPDGHAIDARIKNICEQVDGLATKQWAETIKNLCREQEPDDSKLLEFTIEVVAQSLLNKFGNENGNKRRIMMALFTIELSDDLKIRDMVAEKVKELESGNLETTLRHERNKIEQVASVGEGMREGVQNAFRKRFGNSNGESVLVPTGGMPGHTKKREA